MRIKKTNLYTCDEASDDLKEKIIAKNYDINVSDHSWQEATYGDIERAGLKCLGFDLNMGSYCELKPCLDYDIIAKNIMEEHGENCETYKDARNFLLDIKTIQENNPFPASCADDEEDDIQDKIDDLTAEAEQEFLNCLQNDYLYILRADYEYLTTEAAILERCNDYYFNENGEIDY